MRSLAGREAVTLLLALVLGVGPASAHDDHATLEHLRSQPAHAPDAVTTLLHRAGIARAEGRFAEADSLLDRAWRRAPDSPAVARCRAQLALDLDRPSEALALLAATDTDPRVPWMRADALARLGRASEAAVVMDSMLALAPRPLAEHVLARATLALGRAEEGIAAAVAHLDAGLARRPGAWELVSRALDLELAAGRTDAALARVDALLAGSPQLATLLARRGDILAGAGRSFEAREAWSRSLESLEDRGLRRPADRALAERLRQSLREPGFATMPPTVGVPAEPTPAARERR